MNSPIVLAFLLNFSDVRMPHFPGTAKMGSATRLQIDILDIQQPYLTLPGRRFNRHCSNQIGLVR